MKNRIALFRLLLLLVFLLGCLSPGFSENLKKSIDDFQDESNEANDDPKESMDIPPDNENTENSNINSISNNIKNKTASACSRRKNSRVHEIQAASHKQFAFMAAIMSHQNEFLCSGSVISMGLILTTAECLKKPFSYVLLNTTKAKKDESAVMLYVKNQEKFPSYIGPAENSIDVGLIYTEPHNNTVASKIILSNITNLKGISDFEALGYGLNTDVTEQKNLQTIGVEYRPFDERPDLLEGYFDCIDTKVRTCFKDVGGPAIFDNELIGIIAEGQESCTAEMSSKYAVSKKLVKVIPIYTFKAWLDEKIKKNEAKQPVVLPAYPSKPVSAAMKPVKKGVRSDSSRRYKFSAIQFLVVILMLVVL